MPPSPPEEDPLLHILAKRDPTRYKKISIRYEQISFTHRMTELLNQMLTDRIETSFLNDKIRSELKFIRQVSVHEDAEHVFKDVIDELDDLTWLWRGSHIYYPFVIFEGGERKIVDKDYHYCVKMLREQLKQSINQLRRQNEENFDKSRQLFNSEAESKLV